MLTRKKTGALIKPDCDFESINTVRTFNVRNQDTWPVRILFNVNNGPLAADQDELDRQQRLFFDFVLPESIDNVLLGPNEILPSAGSFEVMSTIKTEPKQYFIIFPFVEKEPPIVQNKDLITPPNITPDMEEEEVMIVGEVKKSKSYSMSCTINQRQLKRNMHKLSCFLKEKGLEETNTQKINMGKMKDSYVSNFLYDLENEYLENSSSGNRRKTTFMVNPDDLLDISKLIDSPVKRQAEETNKNKELKKGDFRKKLRSPSPILVEFSSDDDIPLINNKVELTSKNVSPPAVHKRVPPWKKKTEDEPPKGSSLPAYEVFAPRKEPKLKTVNVNDFMRNNEASRKEAERQRARSEREKRERDDELKIIEVKSRSKYGEYPPTDLTNFKIPRRDGDVPVEKPSDVTEPMKKKIRIDQPSNLSLDILGEITEAMNAGAAAKTSDSMESLRMRPQDDWVLPRVIEAPIQPPSCPPRFAMTGDDSDKMDICNSSPEKSPRPVGDKKEKTISPISSDEGIDMEGRERIDDGVPPIDGGNNGDMLKDRKMEGCHLNLNESDNLHEFHTTDRYYTENLRNDIYRLREVDYVKKIRVLDPNRIDRPTPLDEPKEIALEKIDTGTDPRIPTPSPGSLSRWTNARVELNLTGADKLKEGDAPSKKKKGVQWGETATKEFNPDDEEGSDGKRIETETKKNETDEITGVKEVNGKQYKIVKKVLADPTPAKSCLKPMPPSYLSIDPLYPFGVGSAFRPPPPSIRPPTTPPLTELDELEEDEFLSIRPSIVRPPAPPPIRIIPPAMPTLGRIPTPKLPDFVPPPGFELDSVKKEREERETKEREERERKEREENKKRERDENERKRNVFTCSSSTSPEEIEVISSSSNRESRSYDGRSKMNSGAKSSVSMGNLFGATSMTGGAASSLSLNNVRGSSCSFEQGSEILGDQPPLPAYETRDVRYQLELRNKIVDQLDVHKSMTADPSLEYPDKRDNRTVPSETDQRREQERYAHELTDKEKVWKEDGVQPVWLQSLPYQTHFSFRRDAGLYWPLVQATDGIEEGTREFESMDVLRSLGNNTHFATEKKALLGIEARLPNGMTHKERFEAFFRSTDQPEGRFKNRRMYSRVFNQQSEDDARAIHNERMEKERRLLKEHEETMKKNAPQGVTIERSRMEIDRPSKFCDFPQMIQYYKRDDYENNVPTQDNDWYCNQSDYYMPYTERANYLCHVINHFNQDYNSLYEGDVYDDKTYIDNMEALDKAAFAASQIALGRMEGSVRVGIKPEKYVELLKRNKERRSLIESSSFSVSKYIDLTEVTAAEIPHFHILIDWLSSIFKSIKPISEWRLMDSLDAALRETVLLSDKKDENGRPKDAREMFYKAFHARSQLALPPDPKKSRPTNWDGYE